MNNYTEICTLIDSSENNMFRRGIDGQDQFIHDNQVVAAKEIVKCLNAPTTRRNHVMLVARMQSGKTGVCNCVVNVIEQLGLMDTMGVNKFFFITGMNDCGLKSQTYERVIEQVINANVSNTYIGKRASRFNTDNKYFILKNSDLLAFDEPIDNAVIFIDECHYGSGNNNILSKFLYQNGIDWKNSNELIARNIYIVSVSATPFGELISDTQETKQCVELRTDDEYIGVSTYKENGLIHSAHTDNDVFGDICYRLADSIEQMRANDEIGVCMVRTRDFENFKNDMFIQYNFEVYEMFSNGSKIEYDNLTNKIFDLKRINEFNKRFRGVRNSFILSQKIECKPLLVLIKGAYRAGITLPSDVKDLVYMVYDYSIKSAATAQALLGRMCGYRAKDTKLKTHFYINDRAANMYSEWENDFSDRTKIPSDKVMKSWVFDKADLSSDPDITLSSKSCGNFYISLSDKEIEDIFAKCKNKRTCHTNIKRILPKLFEDHNIDIKYDYVNEAHVQGKNNYAESSQDKRFNAFSEDSLVFGFRPEKMKDFMDKTNRDYLTNDDFGQRCISVVLDAEIDKTSGKCIGGNKRLLVYYVEVGAYKIVANQMSMFEPHKCTDVNYSNAS